MPHLRLRHASIPLKKLRSIWPAIGVLGLRQSGKSTILKRFLSYKNQISFDSTESRNRADRNPALFLESIHKPVLIDEAQKVPALFDELKLWIDNNRRPGQFAITGSVAFSERAGIREALTGRIGLIHLNPMTISELTSLPIQKKIALEKVEKWPHKIRVTNAEFMRTMDKGGMPVPAFMREEGQREIYFRSWFETAIHRDLPKLFKQGFDPDFALSILERMGRLFENGELPSIKHFSASALKLRKYLSAMEEIFLLRKIPCHEAGIGKEVWIFTDSAMARYWMRDKEGEGSQLSLCRMTLWNEWTSHNEYHLFNQRPQYYKSIHGSEVDAVWNQIPFRIVGSVNDATTQKGWHEKAVLGAMKILKSQTGFLVAPIQEVILPTKSDPIGVLPWGFWS